MDPLERLPLEVCEQILLQLSLDDLMSAVQVSDSWCFTIESLERIWRILCDTHLSYCTHRVTEDRVQGLSWQEVFGRNIDYQTTKSAWMTGRLSKPKSADDLPPLPACTLDMDDWEQILDAELSR